MVVGPDYVFLAIPRCASNAIRDWLVRDYAGVHLEPHHGTVIPDADLGKFRFAVVRNPYDRMLSMWYHNRRNSLEPRWRRMGAAEFAECCLGLEFGMNQTEFLRSVRPVTVLWYESLRSLQEGTTADGVPLPELIMRVLTGGVYAAMPGTRVNAEQRPPWKEDAALTPDFIRAVNTHSDPDFSEFGYGRLLP